MRPARSFSGYYLSILLALAIVTAAVVFRDYGIGWDERVSHATGVVNYRYVFEGDTALLHHPNRDYGMAFELPAVILQEALGAEDIRDVYLVRRVLTHALFVLACCCTFLLVQSLYGIPIVSATAFLMLWLHPHIFAHSFFNSKDLPFLSFLAIALYFLIRGIKEQKPPLFLVAGIVMGLLTGTRILGLLYFALGAGWIVYLLISCKQRAGLWPSLIYFTAGWSLALYASWPFLWTSPIGHFAEAFANMSRFRWDLDVLFDGEYINATKVPWFYIPVWFAITSPLLFLVAGAAGIMIVCVRLFKHGRFAAFETQTDLFILLGFLLPLVIVAVLRSVIYDSWRHLYFIYVPFVLLSAAALRQLHTKTGLKTTFVLSSLLVTPTIIFHVAAHPFQYVYFSPIVTSGSQEVRHRFEMDYWGVSYKQALEHVLSIDESQLIKIAAQNEPCERNVEFLPAHLRERFVFVPITEAEYFFTNYRWHPHEYDDLPVKTELIKSFSVQGNAFQSVYRVVK